MGTLARWRNWFWWHVWHGLRQRWYCWRHKVIPLAEAVCIRSITVDGNEQLACLVPGTAFNETNSESCILRVRMRPGAEMSIQIENLTTRPVPVQGALFVTQYDWTSTVYPLLPRMVEPKESATFTVRVMAAGELQRLFIPTHVRRP
jgi:hypothetical protein